MDHSLSALMSVCGCIAPVVRMWNPSPQMVMIMIYWQQWQRKGRRSQNNFSETWILTGLAVVSCHVPLPALSLCLRHTLGLLFILSVGCTRGNEEGSSGRVGPPQRRCLGWQGNTGRSRDMKGITHNSGHQLSVCLLFKLFFSLFFFLFPFPFLPLFFFTTLYFFPLSEAGCKGKWSISWPNDRAWLNIISPVALCLWN